VRVWGKLEESSSAFPIFGQWHGRDGRPMAAFVIEKLDVEVLKFE